MKKLTTLFLLLFLSFINAQTFSGTLFMRDKSNFYLNQIYVTNLNEQKTYLTNYNGEFRIPAKVGDVIRFTSIVSERKDITLTKNILENTNNLIELEVAYKEIQEIILSRFKPTGNLRRDVRSLDSKKSPVEIAKIIGLPAPKGDGSSPIAPVASLANGGVSISPVSYTHLDVYKRQAFNRVKTKFIGLENEIPKVEISVFKGDKRLINGFVLQGFTKVPKRFVKNLEKEFVGKKYDDENLLKINSRLENHPFLILEKTPQTLFTKDSTQIYLTFQKKKANNFDGIIGFGNNDKKKFSFTGSINPVSYTHLDVYKRQAIGVRRLIFIKHYFSQINFGHFSSVTSLFNI